MDRMDDTLDPEPDNDTPVTITQALAYAVSTLPSIGKDSYNEQQGFAYRGIEDILPHVRHALNQAGIIYTPRVVNRTVENISTRSGAVWRLVTLTVDYIFHGPAGDSVTVTTVGEGYDPSDKAASKAMTSALKYALVQTLQIAEGDDVEADAGRQPEGVSAARPRRAVDMTPEELVAPLRETHGPEHAAAVANLIEDLRGLSGEVRVEFMKEHGPPTELTPIEYPEAREWVDERH